MKVSDILWWCKWGVLILIVANSNKLLLFYTVSLNGTCNLSLKGNHLFLRLFDAYCKTFDCSPSFSFSTHAAMIMSSLKISALESSLSFSCFYFLWCLALFARSLISRVFIDFVLSSHWLMVSRGPRPCCPRFYTILLKSFRMFHYQLLWIVSCGQSRSLPILWDDTDCLCIAAMKYMVTVVLAMSYVVSLGAYRLGKPLLIDLAVEQHMTFASSYLSPAFQWKMWKGWYVLRSQWLVGKLGICHTWHRLYSSLCCGWRENEHGPWNYKNTTKN
jgi:hypothetical protein